MIAARNIAIIALLALILTVLPSGGNVADGILTALSLLFLGAIALLLVRFWKESSLTRDAMTDRQRGIVYGGLGAIALMIAGTDELFDSGAGTVAWLLIVGVSAWLIFTTWREAQSI
ncbi:MAG: hypothetical protein KDB58_09935 [Solirubrobacterales bacterium]|nr:hypothetical protein [Solirubrobacterales bacterium]MCB8970682.1 hypothetical protein [Thermoleophilales bacterium]MCO5326472.1 hypothetical protein [Solirubrobacterales bacterium]